jgi:hypothetical protein
VPLEEDHKIGRSIFSSQAKSNGLGASVNAPAAPVIGTGGVFDTPAVETSPQEDEFEEEGVDEAATGDVEDTDDTVRFPKQGETGDDTIIHQSDDRADEGSGAAEEVAAVVELEAPGMCEGCFVDHPLMRPAAVRGFHRAA